MFADDLPPWVTTSETSFMTVSCGALWTIETLDGATNFPLSFSIAGPTVTTASRSIVPSAAMIRRSNAAWF